MPIPLHWHTEPLLLLLVIGVGWLYCLWIGPLRSRIAPNEKYPTCKCISFVSALIIGYLTVGSPLDQIGEDFLFSAHMIQHMLLVYVCPPLLLWGTPVWLADAALQNAIIRKIWRILTRPVFAGMLFTFLYTLWHIPGLYEAALRTKWVHVLEHWCMFLPAIWMWWPIMGPSKLVPPSSYGIRMVYIFALMVGQLPVFAFLTLSEAVLYPTYEFAARITELTPLQDQILGGVIMKVSNMIVSLTVLGTSFYFWYQKDLKDGEASSN
ncbi:cytochrome c oxidase assembly protein [Rubellicoccus peritrichatus]|uniref:Cytochrome c oxidase assembly protein n=1 Tax=Rubellicoccus peritrichatus TaxID=3080537 RepID=A0AAQ3L5D1_9BACT|nr:cytochrome c oxidase assembly protein [Puniceicoccus sp. CR14]WOO39470.1 cytochrome c oxidase assembly protein [Puniceicoccus sp. CR14]